MRYLTLMRLSIIAGAIGPLADRANAQTIQSIGAGSAVTSIDRSADFDALIVNGTPLSDYTEGGLLIQVDGDSWVGDGSPPFDPFHGANVPDRAFYYPYGGSLGWTIIETTDSLPILALEFMYGNGWTTGDPFGTYPWGNNAAWVEWQTWSAGLMVSAGVVGVGPMLEMGTILGFYDASGFDQLFVRCRIANSYDPNLQALALDDLHVQLAVLAPCPADLDGDGFVTGDDFTLFVDYFERGDLRADFDHDGFLTGDDFTLFVEAFELGC